MGVQHFLGFETSNIQPLYGRILCFPSKATFTLGLLPRKIDEVRVLGCTPMTMIFLLHFFLQELIILPQS